MVGRSACGLAGRLVGRCNGRHLTRQASLRNAAHLLLTSDY